MGGSGHRTLDHAYLPAAPIVALGTLCSTPQRENKWVQVSCLWVRCLLLFLLPFCFPCVWLSRLSCLRIGLFCVISFSVLTGSDAGRQTVKHCLDALPRRLRLGAHEKTKPIFPGVPQWCDTNALLISSLEPLKSHTSHCL